METVIAYFDETGDDGFVNSSSDDFVLTSIYTKTTSWQKNYNVMKNYRALLKEKYGFHSTVEMHTKNFLTDKNPYRNYGWTKEQKQKILITYTKCIAEQMDFSCVNVIKKNALFMDYLQNGIEVTYHQNGESKSDIIYIADFENAGKPGDKNSYIIANQWTFIENSNKRPDILFFLNGLPICLFELKSPSREQTDASEADSMGVPVCCSRRSGYSRFRYR